MTIARMSSNYMRALLVCVTKQRHHYNDVIMDASQNTSLTIVFSAVYSDADHRKHQSSASLAFVRGIHRLPMNSPHKWPVTPKMFPFDDVIMITLVCGVIVPVWCKKKRRPEWQLHWIKWPKFCGRQFQMHLYESNSFWRQAIIWLKRLTIVLMEIKVQIIWVNLKAFRHVTRIRIIKRCRLQIVGHFIPASVC